MNLVLLPISTHEPSQFISADTPYQQPPSALTHCHATTFASINYSSFRASFLNPTRRWPGATRMALCELTDSQFMRTCESARHHPLPHAAIQEE
jgi:hypothetical protein